MGEVTLLEVVKISRDKILKANRTTITILKQAMHITISRTIIRDRNLVDRITEVPWEVAIAHQ